MQKSTNGISLTVLEISLWKFGLLRSTNAISWHNISFLYLPAEVSRSRPYRKNRN